MSIIVLLNHLFCSPGPSVSSLALDDSLASSNVMHSPVGHEDSNDLAMTQGSREKAEEMLAPPHRQLQPEFSLELSPCPSSANSRYA